MLSGNPVDPDAEPTANRLDGLSDLRPFLEHGFAIGGTDIVQVDVNGKTRRVENEQVERSSPFEDDATFKEGMASQSLENLE
jgi:hypothetical protein